MIKKYLASTTSKTIHDWLEVFANDDILPQITIYLSPVDIASIILISCKELRTIPVLAPILMHQLTSTTPYHHQELLLYDSLVKTHPLKKKEISECDSLLKKATDHHLALSETDTPLSSDKQRKLIKLYHLSGSPLSPLKNHKRSSQLTKKIQTYIDSKLSNIKKALFEKLEENPGSNEEEKAAHTTAITQMVIDHPLLVFATDKDGRTPLYFAAHNGHTAVAVLLIAKGAEVKTTITYGPWKGDTPLHWAAHNGHEAIATLLLAKGAEVNAKNNEGYTPLYWVAVYKYTEVAKCLIANGANVNTRNNRGETPLNVAEVKQHTDMAQLFRNAVAKG